MHASGVMPTKVADPLRLCQYANVLSAEWTVGRSLTSWWTRRSRSCVGDYPHEVRSPGMKS